MSSRNGRRHRKKTDEDHDFKPPSQSPKKVHEAIVKVDISEENGKDEVKKIEVQVHDVESIISKEGSENGTVEETNGNDTQKESMVEIIPDTPTFSDTELEPLVVDSEEQELQFDDNSDMDSHKGSPILSNRCTTRRSQTRNIPTPKTPKAVSEQNGDDKDQSEEHKGQNGEEKIIIDNVTIKHDNEENHKQDELKSDTPVFENDTETPPPTEENLTIVDGDLKISADFNEGNFNLSVDSCESALSTQVNIGSDVTREIDLTLPDENSFINTAKDLSVIESLRRMSSRRPIRANNSDYRKTLLKSQAEKHEFVLQQQRSSTEKVIGTKRKTRSKTPENPKRFKTESSPGFFSYISSPLSMLRNRFSSSESVSASTPKLTGYREQETMGDPELSKIEDSQMPADKKRCIIM